jgi:hypothetical protein
MPTLTDKINIKVHPGGILFLEDFKKFLDISKVVFYSMKDNKGTVVLKFYDKNKKLIRPGKGNKNGKNQKEN